MPYKEVTGILTDIGTEELAHLEIVCAIVHQLTRNLSPEEIEHSGFAPYYVDHTLALWPQSAGGVPWSATTFQSKGIRSPISMKISVLNRKHALPMIIFSG